MMTPALKWVSSFFLKLGMNSYKTPNLAIFEGSRYSFGIRAISFCINHLSD